MAYRVAIVRYWLRCTPYGCKARASIKVRHYVLDALLSPANPAAQGGGVTALAIKCTKTP
ncbi:hypothetical protein Pfra02_29750 [Pseudomonas fragi]|nr:hypothetical protein Pfra02_29750 [Pseudomonas fragi]